MKIWNAYGSEHSMNLVMIGHFKDCGAAEAAKDALEELQQFFRENEPDGQIYSDGVIEKLRKFKAHSIGATELEQFCFDYRITTTKEKVTITTDEVDVSALWKLLIDRGAKVEIYSAHDYPDKTDGEE